MRYWGLIGVNLVGWWVLAVAPAYAQDTTFLDVVAERQRINQQRLAIETSFGETERVCYQRFAVFDCLRKARISRRAALDDLRHQELVLNDLDRQTLAVDAIKRIQDKASAP